MIRGLYNLEMKASQGMPLPSSAGVLGADTALFAPSLTDSAACQAQYLYLLCTPSLYCVLEQDTTFAVALQSFNGANKEDYSEYELCLRYSRMHRVLWLVAGCWDLGRQGLGVMSDVHE